MPDLKYRRRADLMQTSFLKKRTQANQYHRIP